MSSGRVALPFAIQGWPLRRQIKGNTRPHGRSMREWSYNSGKVQAFFRGPRDWATSVGWDKQPGCGGSDGVTVSMAKTLVIAEKPSVAQDIVRALTPVAGKFDKHDDHFENDTLRGDERRRPPAGDPGAGGVRRQARQVELRAPAGHSALLRPEAHRKTKARLNAVFKPGQAQGRHRAGQCLRRRARRRADLPLDRAVRRRRRSRLASRSSGCGCSR